MPIFNGFGPLAVSVCSGTTIALFDSVADSLTAPATSRVIAPADSGPVERSSITFAAQFASAPTASLQIYGSNTPPTTAGPQDGITVGSAITTQSASVTATEAYAFYWAVLASQSAGGALSLIAHVR